MLGDPRKHLHGLYCALFQTKSSSTSYELVCHQTAPLVTCPEAKGVGTCGHSACLISYSVDTVPGLFHIVL